MSNISIEIDNDFINQLVQEKVESILSNYKRSSLQWILKI